MMSCRERQAHTRVRRIGRRRRASRVSARSKEWCATISTRSFPGVGGPRGRGAHRHRRACDRPGCECPRRGWTALRAQRRGAERGFPEDVAIRAVDEAAAEFNARFSARSRSYRYRIGRHGRRSMRGAHSAAAGGRPRHAAVGCRLLGEHDFRAFTPTETRHRGFVRDVLSASWEQAGDRLDLTITANGFLPWCALSGRCSRPAPMRPRASNASSTGGHGRRPAPRSLRTAFISSGSTTDPGYDRTVRFRIVLFDLDGTLIDSGQSFLPRCSMP